MDLGIKAEDLEPELSEAVVRKVEDIIQELDGYEPAAVDWPWHIQKADGSDDGGGSEGGGGSEEEPVYLDISGTPTPLEVKDKEISFKFNVKVKENGGGSDNGQ